MASNIYQYVIVLSIHWTDVILTLAHSLWCWPNINPYAADFFRLFFIHLKLELLTQFPAPNDEK